MPRWGRGRGCVPSTRACPTNGRILAGICRPRPCRRSESAPRAPHGDPPVRVPKQTGAPIAPPARSHEAVARRWRVLIVCWTHRPLTLQRRPPRRRWGVDEGLWNKEECKRWSRPRVPESGRKACREGRPHHKKPTPQGCAGGGSELEGSVAFFLDARAYRSSLTRVETRSKSSSSDRLLDVPTAVLAFDLVHAPWDQTATGGDESVPGCKAGQARTDSGKPQTSTDARHRSNRQAGGNAAQSKEADTCAALGPIGRS